MGYAGLSDRRAAAADVFDNEVLLQLVRQRLREYACDLVGRSARRVRNDDSDGVVRVGLRPSRNHESTKSDNGQCAGKGALHWRRLLPFASFSKAYAAGMTGNKRHG